MVAALPFCRVPRSTPQHKCNPCSWIWPNGSCDDHRDSTAQMHLEQGPWWRCSRTARRFTCVVQYHSLDPSSASLLYDCGVMFVCLLCPKYCFLGTTAEHRASRRSRLSILLKASWSKPTVVTVALWLVMFVSGNGRDFRAPSVTECLVLTESPLLVDRINSRA